MSLGSQGSRMSPHPKPDCTTMRLSLPCSLVPEHPCWHLLCFPLSQSLDRFGFSFQRGLGKRESEGSMHRHRAAVLCSSSTSTPSWGTTQNLSKGCSSLPVTAMRDISAATRPLCPDDGNASLQSLMVACSLPQRALHLGWGKEEEDLAAGSRGISRDLLDLKERGAKIYLSESCGQGTPEDAACPYQLDAAPRAGRGGWGLSVRGTPWASAGGRCQGDRFWFGITTGWHGPGGWSSVGQREVEQM